MTTRPKHLDGTPLGRALKALRIAREVAAARKALADKRTDAEIAVDATVARIAAKRGA